MEYYDKFDNKKEVYAGLGFGTKPSKMINVEIKAITSLGKAGVKEYVYATIRTLGAVGKNTYSYASNINNVTFLNEKLNLRVVVSTSRINVQTVSSTSSNYITGSLSKEEASKLLTILSDKDSIAYFDRTTLYHNKDYYNFQDQQEVIKDFQSYLRKDGLRINKERQQQKENEFNQNFRKYLN